jgi:hypothetical protein
MRSPKKSKQGRPRHKKLYWQQAELSFSVLCLPNGKSGKKPVKKYTETGYC